MSTANDSRQPVVMKVARNNGRSENPLQMAQGLEGCRVRAADGEIGTLQALCLDVERWAVRYLLVDCAGWIEGRKVLVLPLAVGEFVADELTLCVELTRGQIKGSPPFDAERLISRTYETRYHQYYNWPAYWELDPLAELPLSQIPASPQLVSSDTGLNRHQDRHLLLSTDIRGWEIVARDGSIGTLRDLVVDIRYWLVLYTKIETCRGWPVRCVLLSQAWIKGVDWLERKLFVDLACAVIERAPQFDPSRGISHDYEAQLLEYYGYPPISC